MIISSGALSLLILIALAGAVAAPLILIVLFLRDWMRGELW